MVHKFSTEHNAQVLETGLTSSEPSDIVIMPDDSAEIAPTSRQGKVVEGSLSDKKYLKHNPARLELVSQFFAGDYEGEPRAFLKHAQFTPAEKSLILSDPRFVSLYDAMLFDAFFGVRELTKQETSLLGSLAKRMGIGGSGNKTVNIKNQRVSIRAGKA